MGLERRALPVRLERRGFVADIGGGEEFFPFAFWCQCGGWNTES
jgi:hypothetical protein